MVVVKILQPRAAVATEAKTRSDADIAEALARGNEDTALTNRITSEINDSDDEDTALGGRIDSTNTNVAAVKVTADAAQTAAEVATLIKVETDARGLEDTAQDLAITANETAVTNEATARGLEDTALGGRIGVNAQAIMNETNTRDAADVALTEVDKSLGVRITNVGLGGGGGEVLIDALKVLTTVNRLLSFER